MCECTAASFDALRGKRCCAAIVRMRIDRLTDAYRLSVYRKPELHKFCIVLSYLFFNEVERREEKEMLRKPGICQKPVITLYETPAYAACGTAVGAEPTGVPENGGVADEILFGWQYEVLEENNAFYKIRTHYGYEGWIAAEEYVSMESVGDAGVCYDAQNSGCAMQLLQVCQNIADVLEAERVQARRITTLYAGSLIWAEKDSASGDSSAAARLLQPGWRRVFLPDGMGGLREGYMRSRFLEPCQGQERWRKWAPQRPTVLTERIDAVSQSEPKEQEDADALRSEEAFRESIVQTAYSYLGTQYLSLIHI